MDIDEYQELAKETMQFDVEDRDAIVISILGLSGELGELATEFKKKLRDGESYQVFRCKVTEELGDVFWYLASIASVHGINLSSVLRDNLEKTRGRWIGHSSKKVKTIYEEVNSVSSLSERWPSEVTLEFKDDINSNGDRIIKTFVDGERFGDDLRDNNYIDDYYRFHDIFHFSYAVFLGWSPVVRKFLGIKRRSLPAMDEVEDGGRAIVIDEAISALVFENARLHSFFEGVYAVQDELLYSIAQLTSHLEVSKVSMKSWEEAILSGFSVWRQIRERKNAKVMFNFSDRSIAVLEPES